MKIYENSYKSAEDIPNKMTANSCCFFSKSYIYKIDADYYVVSANLIDRIVNLVLNIFGKNYLQDRIKSRLGARTVTYVDPAASSKLPTNLPRTPVVATPLQVIAPPAATNTSHPPAQQRLPLRYFTLDLYTFKEMDIVEIKKLSQSLFNIEPVFEKVDDSKDADVTIVTGGSRGYGDNRLNQNGNSKNYLLIRFGNTSAPDIFTGNISKSNWQDVVVQCDGGSSNLIKWEHAESVRNVALLLFRVFSKTCFDMLLRQKLIDKTLHYYAEPDFSSEDKSRIIRICQNLGIRLILQPTSCSQAKDLLATQVRPDGSLTLSRTLSEIPAHQYLISSHQRVTDDFVWFVGAARHDRSIHCQAGNSPQVINWNDPETERQMLLLFMRLVGNPVFAA